MYFNASPNKLYKYNNINSGLQLLTHSGNIENEQNYFSQKLLYRLVASQSQVLSFIRHLGKVWFDIQFLTVLHISAQNLARHFSRVLRSLMRKSSLPSLIMCVDPSSICISTSSLGYKTKWAVSKLYNCKGSSFIVNNIHTNNRVFIIYIKCTNPLKGIAKNWWGVQIKPKLKN